MAVYAILIPFILLIIMTKKTTLLILTLLLGAISALAANKAFRVVGDVSLYEFDDKKAFVHKVGEASSGDTIYANAETEPYIQAHKGEQLKYIPATHFGRNIYIDSDDVYPIRLEPTDTLEYICTHKVEAGSFQEQHIIPAMEWAMNYSTNPVRWIYLVFISLGCGLLFRWIASMRGFRTVGLSLVGISLAVTSGAEIMYLLAYEPHATWFLKPSVVGGWGHTILNFILLSAVCATQAILFYNMWCESFTEADGTLKASSVVPDDDDDDDDDDDNEDGTPKWIERLAYLPIFVGIYAIVMIIGEFSATAYFIAGAALVAAAICGAIYQFSKGRIIQGLIFPVCYVLGSVGIAVMMMILGIILVLVAIVGAVIGFVAMIAISFIAGVFSPGRTVDFTDQYGRKHTGRLHSDGTIDGDDGNTYKI